MDKIKEELPGTIDTKAFSEALMEQVRAAGGTGEFFKKHDIIKEMTRAMFQTLLDAEMEEHLGYKRNDRESKDGTNARNGRSRKKVRGDFGEVEVETPRDREGSFEPKTIKKRQTSVGNFTDKVISLYTRGMSTREIEDHLREMYQVEVSPQFITRATESIQTDIVEWQNRPLERVYPVVYVDGLFVSVRSSAGVVTKKCVHIVLGISCEGRQEVLGMWIEESEGAKFWYKVFNDIKARGVQDILILCGDGLKGLPEAVESVFPKTDVQLCVVHQIRNVTKFVPYQHRKQFCKDMKPIYTAPTLEAAELALLEFEEKWGKRFPMSVASWKSNWARLTAFLKYPVELRKMIYTTNAIESLNSQLRKNTSNRRAFPTDDSVIKILFLNARNFSNKWTKRQGWDIVMNQLLVIFGDRLAPEVFDNV